MHHRGTYERPGLVLGLAPGGSVRGAAYRVAAGQWEAVYAYLREREQPTETYYEAWSDVKIEGQAAKASTLVFLSDIKHPQWAGALSLEQQADLIAGARGLSGRNIDYLSDLIGHLREDGVRDHAMETLLKLVQEREGL